MIMIYVVIFILLTGFISFVIQKFKKDKKYSRKFYDFEDNTSVVIAVLLLIFSFIFVNVFSSDPTFSSLVKQIEYGKKTVQPWLESNAYKELIQKDTNNLDLHFTFIKSHFDDNQSMGPSEKNFNREGTFLYNYYTNWSKSKNERKADMGHLCLGLYYYYRDDHALCRSHLEQVHNDKLKYLNTYLGLTQKVTLRFCLKRGAEYTLSVYKLLIS